MAQTSKEQQIEKMGKLKLYELVNHYHVGTELTCAEAVFKACNEYYNLNLSEETRKMFSVMGLGMQTEQSCRADKLYVRHFWNTALCRAAKA